MVFMNRKALTRKKKERILGFVLVLPVIFLIALVIIYPIVYNFRMSFYKVALNPARPNVFTGWNNYVKLLTDSEFYIVLLTTILFVAVSVTSSTSLGLIVALLFNRRFPLRGIARSLILLSYVTPMISLVYVWRYMFNPVYGVVNYVLVDKIRLFSQIPAWFDHKVWAFVMVVVFDTWRLFPYAFMMFLAALQTIDESLGEAAEIDGAGAWSKFRYIIIPEIQPVIVSVVTLRMIWNFYKFDDIYLLTQQVPVLGVYLYKTAFASNDFGLASAITVIMFIIVMSLVFVLRKAVFRKNEA